MLFFPLQDKFGQKHVVEVLKEELEEGRWASPHLSAHFLEGKKKATDIQYLFSFSLGLLEELEDNEWRDTIQLYREEVRKNWSCLFFIEQRLLNKTGDCYYRKQCCATTCSKECAMSGWSREELSVVLGTKTGIICLCGANCQSVLFVFWVHKSCLIINPEISGSVLNEDWTCKDLYGFQKGLSHLEHNFR